MLTDTVSTSCHRVPHGENITGGVFVPIVGSAARACPFTDAQRHLFLQRTALAAHLAAREPAVDLDHGFAVHGGFGLNHPDGVTDSGIAQAAGKAVVLDHAAQVEILDADHVESGNKAPRQLGGGVLAGVGDLFMQHSNPLFLPLVAVRSLHLAGQRLLLALHAPLVAVRVLRVGDALAGGQCGKAAAVIRKPSGKYFVSLVVDVQPAPLPETGQSVGVDFGISRLATLSTGEQSS